MVIINAVDVTCWAVSTLSTFWEMKKFVHKPSSLLADRDVECDIRADVSSTGSCNYQFKLVLWLEKWAY